jgi:alpha-2-macroglobulin
LSINEELKEGDDLTIKIEKGAKILNYIIDEDIENEIETPSKDIVIEEVTAEFNDTEGQIKVITNVEIKAENLDKFVSVVSSKTPEEGKTADMKLSFDMLENGFLIHGDFNAEEVYNLLIKKGLTSKIESKLNADYAKELTFGEMPQSINFSSSKAIYLSAKGNKNIGIKISNIPKVELKVSKIYENNILHYINTNRYGGSGQEYYDEETGESQSYGSSYSYGQDNNQSLSDIILEKKIDTHNLPKSGGQSILICQIKTVKKEFFWLLLIHKKNIIVMPHASFRFLILV